MLWVLKRTVSMRQFFWAQMLKLMGKKISTILFPSILYISEPIKSYYSALLQVVKEVQRVQNGGKAQEITDSQAPWCVVL